MLLGEKRNIMIKNILRILTIVFLTGIVAIGGIYKYGPNFNIYLVPPSTEQYVASALNIMNQGIYAFGEEWQVVKKDALERAKNCSTYKDTYDILNNAIKVAGGKHSCIVTQAESDTIVEEQKLPTVNFKDGLFYVKLPAYATVSNQSTAYTATVIDEIKAHQSNIHGVIIDLRDNTGGDMGPMLAAVSPFLPDGTLMRFRIENNYWDVVLSKGTISGGGTTTSVEDIGMIDVPIAILQNEYTASAGEATLICFMDLENVMTFGMPSAGYCSMNMVYYLYDGVYMQLTVGVDESISGQEYCDKPIMPDITTNSPLEDAIKWLKTQ